MQAVPFENLRLDQSLAAAALRSRAATVNQGRARNVRGKTREDLALPIERQMIVELGDEDMGVGLTEHAADRSDASARRLTFSRAPAGPSSTHGYDYLQFSGDVVEHLSDVLARDGGSGSPHWGRSIVAGSSTMRLRAESLRRRTGLAAPA